MLGRLFCLYRKELKKTVFSKTFILFFSVILISIIISIYFFYSTLESEPYTSSYGVIPYDDYEQLQAHLNHNEEYISELYGQLEVTADLNRRSLIKNEIRHRERLSLIYKYLQSHPEISYSKYYDFGSLTNSGYEDNFSFFVFITTYPIIFMIVGIAVLSSLIVTNDFTNGTYKFVYTSGVSRTKIIFAKLSTFITLLFSSCLLILLIGLIFGFIQYGYDKKYLIMASYRNVFHVGISGYFFLSFLNYLSLGIFICGIIFFISLFFKNNIISLTICAILLFLFLNGYNLFAHLNEKLAIFNVFTSVNIFDVFSVEPVFYNLWKYLIISFAYFTIFATAGIFWFRKKDFC